MDSTYSLTVPDHVPEVKPEKPTFPASYTDAFDDPLHQILDNLEMSIMPQSPFPDVHEDPLSMELSEVENSAVREPPPLGPAAIKLNGMPGKLENEIEHKTSPVQEDDSNFPKNKNLPERETPHQKTARHSWRNPDYSQGPTTMHRETTSSRQYSGPAHRATGQSTGIRNSGRGIIWYCNAYSKWVTPDECDSCDDFEEADFADDEGNVRCQHSFPNNSEDQDKNANENADPDEPTDE